MSNTNSQVNYWKMRKLAKEIMSMQSNAQAQGVTDAALHAKPEYKEAVKHFETLFSQYGNKSMVMNQRRRVSTRKANQHSEQVVTRSAKRSEKASELQDAMAELCADDFSPS